MDDFSPTDSRKLSNECPSSSSPLTQTTPSLWFPNHLVFRPYSSSLQTTAKSRASTSKVMVGRPLVARLTKHLVETYQLCNADFRCTEELFPKRFLTSPADAVLNDGLDNSNSDLILSVNYVLTNSNTARRYIVKDILGHGTFGQVAKCWVPDTNCYVAVKIIKSKPAYHQQAWVEVAILTTLNKKFDPEDKHHIVRIYDYFEFENHLCISFELLDTNLYELIKINHFRGLSLNILQLFSRQILRGLCLMKDAGIIHCDLKPENILLCTSDKPAGIKIIDFGSACMEDRTVYSYIQSRYYRSPEVLLGYQYTTAIDMWSFGCIVAELFLGLPLFPGASEFDLLKRMIHILGGQPPDYLLKMAKNTSKFFKFVGILDHVDAMHVSIGERSAYQALTEEEYEIRENKKPVIGKEYFNDMNLTGIVAAYPYRKNLAEEDVAKENQVRSAFVDFLGGLLEFDPAKRWSPSQALKHPFVTGEPFTCPYEPPPETPHMPVSQNFQVDHHPAGGHWFAAGLSPNVIGRNVNIHTGPHLMTPYAHGSSYGSLGSHNSYTECNGLGSSYGSYGDNYNPFTYFSPVGPSALHMHPQGGMSMVGTSPDARWRILHHPQGLGVSPSTGSFPPLPLGTSPSQFTPPGSSTQTSGPSGHYGLPARGSCHGSSLGKGVAGSHLSRRSSWGYSGSMQSQEESSSHWQGQSTENTDYSQDEGKSQIPGGPQRMLSNSTSVTWKQPHGNSNFVGQHCFPSMPTSLMHGSSKHVSRTLGAGDEKLDTAVLPDPGDWDPNYSDELLLQEESADTSGIASKFSNVVHVDQAVVPQQSFDGIGRFNHDSNASSYQSVQRPSGPNQGFSKPALSYSLSGYGVPCGYGRSMPKAPLFVPPQKNRSGQPPIQQLNFGRSSVNYANEGSYVKLEHSSFSYNPADQHSAGGGSFNNRAAWGRGANPLVNVPQSSRGRKDYGRIT